MEQEIILCVFCGKPYTEKMIDVYNGSYGCETGCEYLTYVVVCEKCKRAVYIKGDFGYFENEKEKQEYISNVALKDVLEALKIKKEYE